MANHEAKAGTGTGWKEVFLGGSKEAEDDIIKRQLAPETNRIQRDVMRIEHKSSIKRGQHNKMLAGTKKAEFQISPDVPEDLRTALFQPGKTYAVHVRFSNAGSFDQPDLVRDLRGVALRVFAGDGKTQDLLMTNAPFSHAVDAREFVLIAAAASRQGRPAALWRLSSWRTAAGFVRLVRRLGLKEASRVLGILLKQTAHPVVSLATERYWSRAPFAFGAVAVKYLLEPTADAQDAHSSANAKASPDLRAEIISRLRKGDIRFDFKVQRYVDAERTPIEDGAVEWKERDAPPVTIASLIIPKQELDAADEADIDGYAFSPWNRSADDIVPLGSLNRARKLVYLASVKLRGETSP